ncbi:MAG: glycosyltransferase [Oscillospiraceae bacterium]|nr:glycosyltransferase [Oscillospiraceae bacterium]
MKSLCIVTTVPITLQAFVFPVLQQLVKMTDWQITVICDEDGTLVSQLPEGVRYIPVAMKRGISLSGLGAVWKLYNIFRKEKFDLVQFSTPNASLYASLAAALAGVPVRLYCQWGIAYVGFSGFKRKVFKAVEKLVCSLATRVSPDSYGNLRFAAQEGLYRPEKGCVVWNGSASGVNLTKFDHNQKELWRQQLRAHYGIAPETTVFGFVGRITGDKGINELFTAFRQLPENAVLMLVGREEKTESLQPELYQWAKSEPRILWCGYTDKVEQFLAAMDVYLLPSYREGFGSGVIEAEAMGVPVIVTDIPGPTDAMKKDVTGLTVPAKDATALQAAMLRLLEDTALRQSLGDAGIAFARENFDQVTLCRHILEDRKQLLGESL